MRASNYIVALILLVWPAVASAETEDRADRFSFFGEIAAGVGYGSPDGVGPPQLQESSINTSYTVGISRWDWTVSAAYLEAKSDQEGDQFSIGYSRDEACPLLPNPNLGCSLGIQWRNVEAQSTVKYSFGVRGPLRFLGRENFEPVWTFGGAAVTEDRSETTLSAGVELPYQIDERWRVTANASAVHGFEANTTLPTFGVAIRYAMTPYAALSVGYQSTAVLDPLVEDELDLDHSATAKFKITF